MISEIQILVMVLIILSGAALAIVTYLISRYFGRRMLKTEVGRSSLNLIVLGTFGVSLIGVGVLYSVIYINSLYPSLLPSFLRPPYLKMFIELVILASSIRSLGVGIKRSFPSLTDLRAADRFLIYGIYGLAIPILVYILVSSPISPRVVSTTYSAIGLVFGYIVTYLVAYVVNMLLSRYLGTLPNKEKGLLTILLFVRRLVVWAVVLIGVAVSTFAAFPRAGVAVASLFVAAGFASIVIGLAAQSSLANIFAGIIISTAQPFKLNDALSYANEWAWVEDIKLTFTVLKTWDNRRLVVPNQLFLNSTLINYDLNDSTKLCIVYVTISYESDVDRAIQIMKDSARSHPDFLPSGNLPVVHLMDIGDANSSSSDANATSGIYLRLLSRAKDQPTNFQMSKDLLYTIRKEFTRAGIKFAYPKRSIVMDKSSGDDRGS